jgi:hypothetical protein
MSVQMSLRFTINQGFCGFCWAIRVVLDGVVLFKRLWHPSFSGFERKWAALKARVRNNRDRQFPTPPGKIWIPVGISILDTLNRWSTLLSRRILYSHRKLFGLIVFFLSRIIHLFASRWGKIIGNYIFYFRKIFRKITKCGVSISIRSSCCPLLNFVGTLFLFSGYFLKVLQQTDLHWKIFKFLRAVWIYIGKWKLRYCWHNAVITVIAYFTS